MYSLLFLACQVSGGSEPHPGPAAAPALPPQAAQEELSMPPLSPSGPFISWLATQDTTLLLPFRIHVTPLGVESSLLLAEPEVPMHLDTGAMGIALDSRLQEYCPGKAQCRVWLKGRYGPLLGGGLSPAGHSFSVYQVIELVDGTPTQARRE